MYICTVIYNTTVLMGTLIVLMVLLTTCCLTGGDYSSYIYRYNITAQTTIGVYVQISGRCMYIIVCIVFPHVIMIMHVNTSMLATCCLQINVHAILSVVHNIYCN